MPATIVLGGQWGDEGKGKITDALAGDSGMVVRANGGSNAGHTISTAQGVFKMHLVPSGILSPGTTCVIGAGVVIDPIQLASELADLRERGVDTSALIISDRAHVVLPFHSEIDRGEERLRGEAPIGTTLRGIGPAYADKVSRRGMRMADLCDERAVKPRLERDFDARNRLLEGYYGSEPVDADSTTHQLLEAAEILFPFVGHAEEVVQDALDRRDASHRRMRPGSHARHRLRQLSVRNLILANRRRRLPGRGYRSESDRAGHWRLQGVQLAGRQWTVSRPSSSTKRATKSASAATNTAPRPVALDASAGSMRSPPVALRGSMA